MRGAFLVAALCCVGCGHSHGAGSGADAAAATDAGGDGGTQSARLPIAHGDYGLVIRTASGAIDVDATIARLVEAHVDLFAYLIYRDPQGEWDTLPSFLTIAAANHIQVWVYLVPPTEVPGGGTCTGSYPPFQLDYVQWAKQIATLSLTHPNLTGFAIDDFGHNVPGGTCTLFTVAYTKQMTSAAHAIAPGLGFYPVLYYPDLEGGAAVVQPIRDSITGVIFPFRDGANHNTYVTSSAKPEIQLLGASLSCQRDYRAATTRGRTGCFEIHYPWGRASTTGAAAGASQMIQVGQGPHQLTFSWQHDFAGTTSGYVFAEVLVDGSVVWKGDIGTNARYTWHGETVSLDAALAGKTTATLELRVAHEKAVSNFGHTVWFDELSATGLTAQNGDFENGATGWTITQSAGFTAMPVQTASLITMVYAATLSSDPQHPPTASYVSTVLKTGLDLSDQGYGDGTMTYVLDIRPPDTAIYTAVKSVY